MNSFIAEYTPPAVIDALESAVLLGKTPKAIPAEVLEQAVVGSIRTLAREWVSVYDDTASIGRLYRRQDEVGTPYCVTVDVQTVGDSDKGETGDQRVTVRERDSMQQERISLDAISSYLAERFVGC